MRLRPSPWIPDIPLYLLVDDAVDLSVVIPSKTEPSIVDVNFLLSTLEHAVSLSLSSCREVLVDSEISSKLAFPVLLLSVVADEYVGSNKEDEDVDNEWVVFGCKILSQFACGVPVLEAAPSDDDKYDEEEAEDNVDDEGNANFTRLYSIIIC